MNSSPLKQLGTLGQSIWLDYVQRELIAAGGLRCVTGYAGSPGSAPAPSIFEQAIADSHGDDADIRAMAHDGRIAMSIYEVINKRNVQHAADESRPLYDWTDGTDGFASQEINPHLEHDTLGTVLEARRLWSAVDRPNVLIHIPATAEGVPAIRQLACEGINVNATLVFGLTRYRQVAEAYMAGLEERLAQGGRVKHVAAVASFSPDRKGSPAVTHALAFRIFAELFGGERFKRLAARGARVQRLLWIHAGNGNHGSSDVKYIEDLIGTAEPWHRLKKEEEPCRLA